ncbi:MAG TPA: metallophosphoesterase [Thermotogota bacterium]|jgi:predicted phosphodiesterase|nr:hypothetical protein [Thermotogaceae bacterium]OQC30823.1 MAG: hypothetical protein BWX67_01534 [Thermotogota bacterium ADurb.Bin062]HNW46769.1 metallophosphoesterase [Thermotogota bacterium]HOD91678.1 metallophosphoesterase [Thermotogota bacterium]HOF23061.1 metallophosphoesterase [Thermotogota bacterium]
MIYISGDTHGTIDSRFSEINFRPEDFIIILGDFGFLWEAEPTEKEAVLLRELGSKGSTVLFIDGNHENFDRLDRLPTETRFGAEVGVIQPGLYHLRRGNIYTIDNRRFFAMGGGLSIDKEFRIPGLSWWPQEQPSWEETQHALETLEIHDNEVDYVLTHAAPLTIKRIVLRGDNRFPDPTEQFLESLYPLIRFKLWFFGHYHVNVKLGHFIGLYDDWYALDG